MGQPDVAHEVALATGDRLIREAFAGEKEEALARLRQLAQKYRFAQPPTDEAGFAEKRLLNRLAGVPPVAYDEEAHIDYYEQAGPYLLSAAIRRSNGKQLRRIVSWGIAMPMGDAKQATKQWMLFVMAKPMAGAEDGVLELRPPGAELVLAIQTPEGGMSAVFRGEGEIDLWKKRFENKLTEIGCELQHQTDNSQTFQRGESKIQLQYLRDDNATTINITTTK